jgi:hypothetical protein
MTIKVITNDQGSGIDKGIARDTILALKLNEGIKGRARWFATKSLPQAISVDFQRSC